MFDMKNIILTVILAFFCGSMIAFPDKQSTADQFKAKTISLLLKSCAKAYLMKEDFQALKNNNIKAINRMTKPQFEADYVQTWAVLQKCPDLVTKYRLRQNLTKKEALKIVGRLTRQDCMDAVDSIPDKVLIDLFNDSMNKSEMQGKPLNEQISIIMKKGFGAKGN